MPYGLPPLPQFRDGSFLGAGDLNRIGQTQSLIHQVSDARPSIPFEHMAIDDPRHMIHRHRYLHWKTTSATTATLNLNGSPVDTATGADSGVVDLNSLGLGNNEGYELEWTGTAVNCVRLYESASATGILTLPETNPTFTTGANDTQLNAVSDNTKYLLDNAGRLPNAGFVAKTYSGIKPSLDVYWQFIHRHRYLYWSGEVEHNGDEGDDSIDVQLQVNGATQIWEDQTDGRASTGGRFSFWEFWIDLQGTNHSEGGFTSSGMGNPGTITIADGSTLGLSPGDEYQIEMNIDTDTTKFHVRTYMMGEFAQKTF